MGLSMISHTSKKTPKVQKKKKKQSSSKGSQSIDEIEPQEYDPDEVEEEIRIKQRLSMSIYRKTSQFAQTKVTKKIEVPPIQIDHNHLQVNHGHEDNSNGSTSRGSFRRNALQNLFVSKFDEGDESTTGQLDLTTLIEHTEAVRKQSIQPLALDDSSSSIDHDISRNKWDVENSVKEVTEDNVSALDNSI